MGANPRLQGRNGCLEVIAGENLAENAEKRVNTSSRLVRDCKVVATVEGKGSVQQGDVIAEGRSEVQDVVRELLNLGGIVKYFEPETTESPVSSV